MEGLPRSTQACIPTTPATDTIVNSGLEIAGNNPNFGTPGASDSLMKSRQWGFAPRVGIAWTPTSKLTVRAGFGMYYDRGEFFSYLSPPRRRRLQRTVRRHPGAALSFRPNSRANGRHLGESLRNQLPPRHRPAAPPRSRHCCRISRRPSPANYPAGNAFGPFLFGGYDINNKLPYTENWTFDLQYQAANDWLFSAGYVGNHGQHEILPIPFNQPLHRHAAAPGQRPDLLLRRHELRRQRKLCRSHDANRSRPANTPATRPSACPISATT